jgi:membrane-bound lytic murein transglycosylase B
MGAAALVLLGACESDDALEGGPGAHPSPSPSASGSPSPRPSNTPRPTSLSFQSSGDPRFDTWRLSFAGKAENAGRRAATITSVLEGLTPLPQTTAAVAFDQPEFTKPIWDYARARVTAGNINTGQTKMNANDAIFDALEQQYAVPREILVAIWSMESGYGSYIGDIDAPRAIATQAASGNRVSFYEGELLAVMKLIDDGEATREQFRRGSWAGAVGQTQFMPSTLVQHGRDYDRDGREDVWNNAGDALASAANYLTAVGWKRGQPWAVEIKIPDGFDWSLGDGQKKTVAQWAALGITPAGATPLGAETLSTELFLPAGSYGPAFLLYDNFSIIKRYNNADSYALAVGLLADRIAGRPDLSRPWPTNIRLLSQAQVTQMQQALTRLGYDTRGADGLIGRNTRKAVQAFQKDRNITPADGFATTELFDRIMAATSN